MLVGGADVENFLYRTVTVNSHLGQEKVIGDLRTFHDVRNWFEMHIQSIPLRKYNVKESFLIRKWHRN